MMRLGGEEVERIPTNKILSDVASRHDEIGGEEASKGEEYPFLSVLLQGRGNIKQGIIW